MNNGFAAAGFRALAFEKKQGWCWLGHLGFGWVHLGHRAVHETAAGRLLPDGSSLLDSGLDFSQLRRPQLLPTAGNHYHYNHYYYYYY